MIEYIYEPGGKCGVTYGDSFMSVEQLSTKFAHMFLGGSTEGPFAFLLSSMLEDDSRHGDGNKHVLIDTCLELILIGRNQIIDEPKVEAIEYTIKTYVKARALKQKQNN